MQQNVVQIVSHGIETGKGAGHEPLIFWPVLCVIDHDVAEWKAATTVFCDENSPVKSTAFSLCAPHCVQQNVVQKMDDAE